MNLSKSQKEAVEYLGRPTLVIAGAGSGKTRVLTHKVAYIVEKGFKPDRILAITFTNKAANEMKSRLEDLLGMQAHRFPWVRTFHSACSEIIKKNYSLLGFKSRPQIYSIYHQKKLLKEILEALNIDKNLNKDIAAIISKAKNSGDPLKYFEEKPIYIPIRITDVFKRYEKELKKRNAIDFDNMLLLCRNLFRDNIEVRQYYQELFQYILIDEYQDTNNIQEELTSLLLKNGSLFCVGDDCQAIYSFRGSNIDHFLNFEKKYHPVKIFKLEENFRSTNNIVNAANSIIENNKIRLSKKCFSNKSDGLIQVEYFNDDREEAIWIAEIIQSLEKSNINYDQIAVLYRNHSCSLPIEKEFRQNKIPVKILTGNTFFQEKEIIDISCYLNSAVFPNDDISFSRIINIPTRGIGSATTDKIKAFNKNASLQESARCFCENINKNNIASTSLKELLDLIDSIKNMTPVEAINSIIKKTNYSKYLKAHSKTEEKYNRRIENIEQLISYAKEKRTIEEFVEDLSLMNESKEEDQKTPKVTLSTIHSAKGLEFRVIFLIGCEENLLPHYNCKGSLEEVEEERRLFYVAATRAKEHLYMSCAQQRGKNFNHPSRFLDEILETGLVNKVKKNI